MTNLNLIILSYHKFVETQSDYRFSRTYDQFYHDIRKKVYDEIHIDDAKLCTIRACEMLREVNRRAKIFVCTSLIGTEGFCTWEQLKVLSEYHDIEAHSDIHKDHTTMTYEHQYRSIYDSICHISNEIGKFPRFFVPPYNQFNGDTVRICKEQKLQLISGRENILNISK